MHNEANSYYKTNGVEAIDVIDALELNFNCGSAMKYLFRAGKKDSETRLKDLRKAVDYLQHEIEIEEAKHADPTAGE